MSRRLMLVAALVVFAPLPALAQSSPALIVPADRYTDPATGQPVGLRPTSILGDSTAYGFNFEPGCNEPFYFDLDTEENLLFAAAGNAIEIYDLTTGRGAPVQTAVACRPVLSRFRKSDTDFYYLSVDAPEGDSSIVAAPVLFQGMVFLDTSNPANPLPIYHDQGASGRNVRTVTVGGTHYAILHAGQLLIVYNMSAAQNLSSPCLEDSSTNSINCPGVYVGKTTIRALSRIATAGHYVAVDFSNGIEIWDLSNPSSPVPVSTVGPKTVSFDMWEFGGRPHIAIGTGQAMEIYRLDCVGAICNTVLLSTTPVPGGRIPGTSVTTATRFVKASVDRGVPHVYIESGSVRGAGPQREWLFDVSDPTTPTDLTPKIPGRPPFWEWYYEDGADGGFWHYAPTSGVVTGGYFYHSGWSILDAFEVIAQSPPMVNSVEPAVPTSVTPCQRVEYSADAIGTLPLTFLWEYIENVGGSSAVNGLPTTGRSGSFDVPENAAIGTTYQFNVTVSGPVQPSDSGSSALVTVIDWPASSNPLNPVINSLSAPNPASGGDVLFDLSDDGGATKWEWNFDVDDLIPGTQTEVFYDATAGRKPVFTYPQTIVDQTFTAEVTISNCVTGSTPTTMQVQVTIPKVTLKVNNFETTLSCFIGECAALTGQAVGFTYDVVGSPDFYDYDWDGNGSFEDTDNTLPVTTHTFNAPGSFKPVLRVRQGSEQATFTHVNTIAVSTPTPPSVSVSGPSSVEVDQVAVFSAFASNCNPIPSAWSWTVDGGAIVGPTSSSQISVSWSSSGNKVVRATAAGGGCSGTQSLAKTVNVRPASSGPGPTGPLVPSFTISNDEPELDEEIEFDASASTGGVETFAWDFGDGTTVGPSASLAKVKHAYTDVGDFDVELTISKSSGCPPPFVNFCAEVLTKTVMVEGDRTGGMEAKFVIVTAASNRAAGLAIVFDAADSTGGVEEYEWDFGDSQKPVTTGETTVSHVYDNGGTYTVKLRVFRDDTDCPGGRCVAEWELDVEVQDRPRDGTCEPSDTVLCLRNFRFQVEGTWETASESGPAMVVPSQTDDSGLFYFFAPKNWEVMVKVLDGCDITGAFWFLAASTTDVGHILTVTDTKTMESRTYVQAMGGASPAIVDTEALDSCPVPDA